MVCNQSLIVGLVGNPNCGKTTLFNALTGARQRVGNWPGVTVERKSGTFQFHGLAVEVIDLPGAYALTNADDASLDERIACDFILENQADVIVNILDASNLERNLYLTMQLIELNKPVVLAINMMDVAKKRGIHIQLKTLSDRLGCPVIALEAHKKKGITALKQAIVACQSIPPLLLNDLLQFHPILKKAIDDIAIEPWITVRLLENDKCAQPLVTPDILASAKQWQQKIYDSEREEADILLADARYQFIQTILKQCIHLEPAPMSWTTRLDSIVLHRWLGIPIFLGIMYSLFLFVINVGGAFQDFFDISSNTIFVDGLAYGLNQLHAPVWLIALLANGIGKGINTTITFIPVIGALFLFLAFLEDSGYMARAAFVVDRIMQALGLPGKSFVPMIVGFGCNVPAVMAARTLDNPRDRILTIMMSPFMSCGARLAIYAVFTTAFFPVGGQNIVFLLYLIGIGMAMLTGLFLRKTLLRGDPAPLVMELPPYHFPHAKTILLLAWQRLKGFVFRAGKLIIPICVLIGGLSAINMDGTFYSGDGNSQSLLSVLGRYITPLFAPMGIQEDNWPATVGLLTGVLAKEVVVGSLNSLYAQLGNLTSVLQTDTFSFWQGLQEAVLSIRANLGQLSQSLGNPVVAQAPIHSMGQGVYGIMYQKFHGQVAAFAYLLFVLLYFPCVSTTAVMVREVNRGWAFFSVIWTTGVAYCVATAFYQIATFTTHPVSSMAWVTTTLAVLIGTMLSARWFARPTMMECV